MTNKLDDLFCPDGDNCYPAREGFFTTQLAVACSQDESPINAYPVTVYPTAHSVANGTSN